MARVICKLPNASTLMIVGAPSGSREVKFVLDRGQALSEDVPDDVADHLDAIEGFEKVKPKKAKETDAERATREAEQGGGAS